MSIDFQMAAGSILGSEHARLGKNNQDAWQVIVRPAYTIAIVADGCSSGIRSEFGAQLGARMIAEMLSDQMDHWPWMFDFFPKRVLEKVRLDALEQLDALIPTMGRNRTEIVNDFFLFTLVGGVISPRKATFFSLGDGVIAINGQVTTLGPFPDNAPPYLAYGLVETGMDPELLRFQVQAELPTARLESWMIGSDGVGDLMAAADRPLPGKTGLAGHISRFWTDDRMFSNPDYLRRQLSLMNREAVRPDWDRRQLVRSPGLLPDDTTLIVGRK